jgi:lipopolysaccharide transport system permease protein
MSSIPYIEPLIQARGLIWAWTQRVVRARYQQSILGGVWAVIQPAATVAIFSVIFTRFVPVDTGTMPYVVFSYAALVPWTLFATALTDMANAIVDNMGLVAKIYFPREVLLLSALLARLLDFGIASCVLVLLMFYFRLSVFSLSWLYLPLILLIQLALALGLGLMSAALNVFYRDIKHLLVLGLQLWFYASPIIYPASLVPEHLRSIFYLNPMAGILTAYRAVLLYHEAPGTYLILSAAIALLMLGLGYACFKHLEFQFADIV